MTSAEIRARYLKFFADRGHAVIPSAPLVPENDPTTLFTGSGMQPMVPYLLGEKHPLGTRLTDAQKSFRTGDIEDIGDNRHTTFFEMLGNWSLGDYFKKEQLEWIFTFLTDEVGIDPNRLFVTAFIGDEKNNIPKDEESAALWRNLFAAKGIDAKVVEIGSEENGGRVGMQGGRIFYYDAGKNWWSRSGRPEKMPAGEPGGPDSEMFYEFSEVKHDEKFGQFCHPNCDCGRYIEIGNSVFMEYRKNEDGSFSKLAQRNVDFGGGLERITAASVGTADVFKTNIFSRIINKLEELSGRSYADSKFTAAFRIVADHIRASAFLIGDGVLPSNTDQGYFVRRLIRRAVRYWDNFGIKQAGLSELIEPLLEDYQEAYPETYQKRQFIAEEIGKEEEKFRLTLEKGLREISKMFERNQSISGKEAFDLYQSYGFPIEITEELAKEKGLLVNRSDFADEMKKHQDLSRLGAEQKFKGGLGGSSEQIVKYHTATHLLHAALRQVLGPDVGQKGSNITDERLRFDFSWPAKMTDEQKMAVEKIVNEMIAADLPVRRLDLPKAEADKTGAIHFFGEKYGDIVSVYYIGESLENAFSKEYCGGPHVEHTGVLGHFKIAKEEAVAAGVRRIKAVLS
jgi:alanyl-tRNA synthetase